MRVCPLCRIALTDEAGPCPRDGREGIPADAFVLPAQLERRFRLVEPFGRGSTGTLFLVDDGETGRRGILKVLSIDDPRGRIRRELVRQANLTGSDLARVLVTGELGDRPWLFREWVDGVSLAVRLARSGPLPRPEALAVASALAQALDDLHRAGLTHRDLKPGHVILLPQPSGVPRTAVIDAGVAAPCPGTSGAEGSAETIAPEVARGGPATVRSDLFSLGCVLFEMLTGTAPFALGEGSDRGPGGQPDAAASYRDQPTPPPPGDLPSGLAALLAALLAKDPAERPLSAQRVRRALQPFLVDDGDAPREPTLAFDVRSHVPVPRLGQPPAKATAPSRGTLRPPAVSSSGVIASVRGDEHRDGGDDADPVSPRGTTNGRHDRGDATVPLDLDELEPVEGSSSPGPRWASPPPPAPSSSPFASNGPPTGGSWDGLTGGFQ